MATKKIKDLTDEETTQICKTYENIACSLCPLVTCGHNPFWTGDSESEVEVDD